MQPRSALMVTAVLSALVLAVPGLAGSPEPSCAEAPLGAAVGKVLEMYKDAQVTQEATPYIESIGNYALEEHFKGGLQRDDSGICFLPNIVRKYTVSSPDWKGCRSFTLYFGAFEKGADDYRLFMVKKTHPAPAADADFKEVFGKMAGRMDGDLGTGHKVDQGRIQSFGEQTHSFYLPALVGTWDGEKTLSFLMVANGPEGPLPPEEVTVSKAALKRYLEVCKTL